MLKKLFLLVIMSTSAQSIRPEDKPVQNDTPVRTVSWTPVKKQTVSEIVGNSVKYSLENPIKVLVGSFLILNLCIHGKQSITVKGINWASRDLPRTFIEDTDFAINGAIEIAKNSYKSLFA